MLISLIVIWKYILAADAPYFNLMQIQMVKEF